ncbi:MAG: hypothetical protein M1818_005660 [Claussenomyces sp. TS43310]|nr:MAG: hypothetical protein M1818_005660 [Claussenomyces sp. TS43310]
MGYPQKLHELYAEHMAKRHDYGYPLYEPEAEQIIRPGLCGYINQHGLWNPIVDLEDLEDLQAKGLTALMEVLAHAPDKNDINWGPKCSENVSGRRVGAQIGASALAAGIPVEAAAVYEYKSSSNFGAILMTKEPILRKALYHDYPFRVWVRENTAALLRLRPEIKEHGLWMVKSTYSTPQYSLNVWTAKEKEVVIGFKTKIVQAGEIGPHADWYESSQDSGWISSSEDNKQRKVVFFGGLKFRFSKLSMSKDRLKEVEAGFRSRTFRGSDNEEEIPVDSGENGIYGINCHEVGALDLSKDEGSDFDF